MSGKPTPFNGRSARSQEGREAAGLPRIHFDDLRHSCVTFLAFEGVSDTVMQKVPGHSTVTITKSLNVHVLERQKEKAAQKVDAFFQAANREDR